MKPIAERIAEELNVRPAQVAAAIGLSTRAQPCPSSPATARRRPARSTTRNCARWRRASPICASWRTGGRRSSNRSASRASSTAALEAQILEADTKARLEDIYLPFKPKRRTKAQIARENGLEPLADALLAHPEREPLVQAEAFVKPDAVKTAQEALDGARAILTERFAEDAELIGRLREDFWKGGRIVSKVREGKEAAGAKFSDYFDFFEPLTKIPSHRALALMRGEREEVLDLKLVPDPNADPASRTLGPVRTRHRPSLRHRRPRPAGRPLAPRHRPLGVANQDRDPARGRSAPAHLDPGRGRGGQSVRRQSARSAARRAGRRTRRPSVSIRASAPGSRSRWSMRPARSSRPPRSIRTSRSGAGTRASPCSRRSPSATRPSSSRSATARLLARPTSWPPT